MAVILVLWFQNFYCDYCDTFAGSNQLVSSDALLACTFDIMWV